MQTKKTARRAAETDAFSQLLDMVHGMRVCMLTTQQTTGDLVSRPMTPLQSQDPGVLWFFMAQGSHQASEMLAFPRVNLNYTDPNRELYVSVSGSAELIQDQRKARELWNPALKAWFPGGVADPELTLLRVDVTQAEYWDARSGKSIQLFDMLHTAVTGEPSTQDTKHDPD